MADPFEGLDEQLGEVEGEADDESAADQGSDAGDEPTVDETTSEPATEAPDAETDDADDESADSDDEGGPAFEFDNDMQQSIYIRDEVWDAFVDTVDFEVKRELREDGVREITGREIQDAALRVATKHPEEIADEFLELRRES